MICVTRARHGQIEVEQDAGRSDVVVVQLDAPASARTAWLGFAGVADKQKFGIDIQAPQGKRALQPRYHFRAQAEFRATRGDKRSHQVGWRAIWKPRLRSAARVIAVKTAAGVDKKFGLAPRTEDKGQLRRDDMGVLSAAVAPDTASDIEPIRIVAQACYDAKPGLPLHDVLEVDADATFTYSVLAYRVGTHAVRGIVDANLV